MKRVINAAGYSPEARALDHNFYVRDEAGKLYGPYFDAQDVRFGDKQLLFVKPKSGEVYYLLDENCKIKNDKSYVGIVGKAFGKYILVEDNDKYFLLNQELEKCSEEYDKVYKNKSYDKFLTVEQKGKTFRLYPDLTKVDEKESSEIVEISNDNEEVIEFFNFKRQNIFFDGFDFADGLLAAMRGSIVGIVALFGIGFPILIANLDSLSLWAPWAPTVAASGMSLGATAGGAILGIGGSKAILAVKEMYYSPENIEKRNIKKITKNSKKMNRINKKLERLNERKETLQEELDDLTSERKADLAARRDALLERAQTIENKMKTQAGDFVSDGRKDRKLEKMEQKASKKSKKLGARQAEIDKLRKELEKLETENEIRKAEYVAVNREKADKMERQSAEIDKARNERPLLDELVELEDGAKE